VTTSEAPETWRVECEGGEVREVEAWRQTWADADEAERLREALRFLCRADVERCWFCGATATKRSPSTSWWCDVCAPPDAVDHEHAATLRPLLPPRGGAK